MPAPQTIARSLAERIRKAADGNAKPFLLAIDGRSGAGKSTLAKILSLELQATLIKGDDFFAGGVELRSDPPQVLADICIDWRTQAKILQTLIANRNATYHPFDWEAFDGRLSTQPVTLTPERLLILEGVYSARPELTDLLDFRVLLHMPDDERMRRLRAREGQITDWEQQWHKAEDWYFANLALPNMFDLVIGA